MNKKILGAVVLALSVFAVEVKADYPKQNKNQGTSAATISDEELLRKVRDKISSGWFTKGYDQVNIRVMNGTVTLEGSVPTLEDKAKVENEVLNIRGVRNVNSRVTVLNIKSDKSKMESTLDKIRNLDATRNLGQRTPPADPYPAHRYTDETNRGALANDQEIYKKIHDAIASGWFSKGYDQVSFDVNNGIVFLEGLVPTMNDKEKLEITIRNINGVRNLHSQLAIQESQRRASDSQDSRLGNEREVMDQDLNKRIHEKLSSGWFSKGYDQVSFQIYNGNVILQGTVPSMKDKEKVQNEISNLEGVRSLNSQIIVQNPSGSDRSASYYNQQGETDPAKMVSDQDLNKKIQKKLAGGWFSKGFDQVRFQIFNGNVTLEGSVPTMKDKEKLEREIRDLDGVRSLDSQLDTQDTMRGSRGTAGS